MSYQMVEFLVIVYWQDFFRLSRYITTAVAVVRLYILKPEGKHLILDAATHAPRGNGGQVQRQMVPSVCRKLLRSS